MRVCPECGHVDPIWWRPAVYHPEFSYAHIEALKGDDPELMKALAAVKRGEIVQRGPFLYWTSARSETVRRVWVEDYKIVRKRGSPQERVRFYTQTKLDEPTLCPGA